MMDGTTPEQATPKDMASMEVPTMFFIKFKTEIGIDTVVGFGSSWDRGVVGESTDNMLDYVHI